MLFLKYRYCTEDNFDKNFVSVVECPSTADVCIRAIQINNGGENGDEENTNNSNMAGSVFRACGTSEKARAREILSLGFYPVKDSCIVRKIGGQSVDFNNSVFQICACASELSNGRGEMKCEKAQPEEETKIIQPFEI